MTASPLPYLDHLDALRAAATPGPWQVDSDSNELAVTAGTARGLPGSWRGTDRIYTVVVGQYSGEEERESEHRAADATCIVASVNAMNNLTAALRAVWAFADAWDHVANSWGDTALAASDPDTIDQAVAEAAWYRERAVSLRAAIAAALGDTTTRKQA